MKMPLRGVLVVPLLITGNLHLAAAPAAAVAIPDKNLEAAVRAALHEPKAELTDDKLATLSVLHAGGKDIRDLTGLEKCKNLAELRLSHNQVRDVRPLQGLPLLQSLDLAGNKIADVAPLATLAPLLPGVVP
jgi:internalin A